MRLDGHVACRETGEVYIGFWLGGLREEDYPDDLVVDGSVLLRWIFRKWDEGAWTGLLRLGIGTGGGSL
jgi:hypothetical protein